MSHWAAESFDEFESTVDGTGWSFDKPSSDEGPVEFETEDGSEVSFTDSRDRTGTVAVEYTPSEEVTPAVTLNKNGGWMGDYHHKSFTDVGKAVEWVVHILEKHEEDN